MNSVLTSLVTSVSTTALLAFAVFLARTWITRKLEEAIKHEYAKQLEEIKLENSKQIEGMKAFLQEESHRNQERWLLKKEAYKKALKLANAMISNTTYPHAPEGGIEPQTMGIEEARECWDDLACTCSEPEVLDQLKAMMFHGALADPGAIVHLRNAIRKKLGFSTVQIDNRKDGDVVFLARPNWIRPTQDEATSAG